ncbi:MAG: hypothetical protein ABW110_19800 [Steroidobacteraceae bacterium]
MATAKSKSRVRSPENRSRSTEPSPAVANPSATSFPIIDLIEAEPSRLMTAAAVLHCVVLAMYERESADRGAPYYPSVVEVAREMIVEAIDRLDSIHVRPLLGMNEVRREFGVKEHAGEYVH